eukprot:s1098_g14.t1
MDLPFVWQVWHLRHWAGSGDGLGRGWAGSGDGLAAAGPRVTLRLFCVAGVALRFVWQAWHLRRWANSGDGLARGCVVPCGAYGTGLALVTALVAAGPARHLVTSTFVLCGRCGTYGTGLALVTALVATDPRVTPRLFSMTGVALGDVCLRFVWHAWHLATWTFVLSGRCGTYGTGLALVTALVAAGPV